MEKTRIDVDGYEVVYRFTDDNFRCFIALHSTHLGPALGGCRVFNYDNDDDALADALKLSKGMTYKCAAAQLNFGGAKCVVNAPKATREVMLKVGEAVDEFHGQYITGEDVGVSVADIRIAAERTQHVLSLGAGGDPSPWTAIGVYECIKMARSYTYLDDTILPVWVQGLGKVGWELARLLHEDGHYKLVVSDMVANRVRAAIRDLDAIEYQHWMSHDIDIYAPCAMGGVIADHNVNEIQFPVICGSANNQLERDEFAQVLHDKGIIYCPDFIVNAGGVICAANEKIGWDDQVVDKAVHGIADTLQSIIKISYERDMNPLQAAIDFASLRLR